MFSLPTSGRVLGYQRITSLTSVVNLAPPFGAEMAYIEAEASSVRWRDDGTVPTPSVGTPLPPGPGMVYSSSLADVQFIAVSGSPVLDVIYYGSFDGPSAAVAVPVTWNPADKDPSIALSGGNFIATASAASTWVSLRATLEPVPPAKAYFRAAINSSNSNLCGPGVASATAPLNNFIGVDDQGILGITKAGSAGLIFYGGSQVGVFPTLVTNLDYVVVAVDGTAKKVWFTVMTAAGVLDANWDSVGDSPAGGTGGFSISSLAGPLYLAGSFFTSFLAMTIDATTVISDPTLGGFRPYGA